MSRAWRYVQEQVDNDGETSGIKVIIWMSQLEGKKKLII